MYDQGSESPGVRSSAVCGGGESTCCWRDGLRDVGPHCAQHAAAPPQEAGACLLLRPAPSARPPATAAIPGRARRAGPFLLPLTVRGRLPVGATACLAVAAAGARAVLLVGTARLLALAAKVLGCCFPEHLLGLLRCRAAPAARRRPSPTELWSQNRIAH